MGSWILLQLEFQISARTNYWVLALCSRWSLDSQMILEHGKKHAIYLKHLGRLIKSPCDFKGKEHYPEVLLFYWLYFGVTYFCPKYFSLTIIMSHTYNIPCSANLLAPYDFKLACSQNITSDVPGWVIPSNKLPLLAGTTTYFRSMSLSFIAFGFSWCCTLLFPTSLL